GSSSSYDTLSDFSTRGRWVQILAPGEKIVSSIPCGRYGTWRGTSMSAPIVSGIAALIEARNHGLRSENVVGIIRGSSIQIHGTQIHRVDAQKAVLMTPLPPSP